MMKASRDQSGEQNNSQKIKKKLSLSLESQLRSFLFGQVSAIPLTIQGNSKTSIMFLCQTPIQI